MFNYVTKSDSNSTTGVDTSKFASLKFNIDKIDNRLKTVPVNSYKLNNVVKKEVVKKDV